MISAIEKSSVDPGIASKPNNIEVVPSLLEEITSGAASLKDGDDNARQDLIIKARSLVQALETPRETMAKHIWAQTGAMAGLCLGVDTGLWTLMASNGDKPQKVSELAKALGVEQSLLSRLMRHLGAMGYITETGIDEYKPTNYTKAMSLPSIGDSYMAIIVGGGAATVRFAEYARLREWKNPADATDTAAMYAYDTKSHFFAWLQSKGYGEHFNNHMTGYRQGRPPWFKCFPVSERLIDGADLDPDAPFLVDVGGNIGHDLMEFKSSYPDHPGKLILQDLPVVISQIPKLDPAIRAIGYDFMLEPQQPTKGARAYYLHSVLHDWPDDDCQKILGKIVHAMKPGYSKVLINEHVVPNFNAYWETSALDMTMMALGSSKERVESDWVDLIEKAGLKIVKIWSGPRGVESMIECELA